MFLSFTCLPRGLKVSRLRATGGHHDAQKFRKTALPRKSFEFDFSPSNRLTLNGAASLANNGEVI